MATLIKTQTAGWYEDPAKPGTKVRKKDGDVVMTRDEYEAAQKGDVVTKARAEAEANPVILSTGKLAKGETLTITCKKRGCSEKRVILKQDAFQVKFCVPHQKENRNELRKARRRAMAKASK